MHRTTVVAAFGVLCLFCTPPGASAQTAAEAEKLMQQSKYAQAVEVYAKVVKAEPDNGVAWVRYGRALLENHELDRAIEVETRAASIESVRPRAWFNIACAQAMKGDRELALSAVERAAESGFPNEAILLAEPKLQALRSDPRFAAAVDKIRKASDRPEYHALDFWVGEWDVYHADGTLAGTNRIESVERGSVIAETWSASGGGSGRSMNFWNPENKRWRQVWVDMDGTVLTMDGEIVDGAMRFVGKNASRRGQVSADHRTVLTPLPGGRVRQTIHSSGDGGKTWSLGFDAVYVPKGRAFVAKDFPTEPAPGAT